MFITFTATASENDPDWIVAEQIVQRIEAPTIPAQDYDIRDYGLPDGDCPDASAAIAAAIAAASEAGGGRVVIPEGKYLTGPIVLKSHIDLHLEAGAHLLFSTDPSDYPLVFTRWEGVECMNYSPLIYAFEETDVAITGDGILDGQATADNWWPWKGREEYGWEEGMPHQEAARDRLLKMAEEGVAVEERIMGEGAFLRPQFIQPYRCERVLIEGVTIIGSPMWEVHPVLCRSVQVRGITVRSHGPNNDGCNPESSRDVLIESCVFDTGDDCIAIKSGRNADGRRINIPSENIVVRGCTMKDGHGGVVIGSEIAGGCRNVYIEDCVMDSPELERALRIKTNSERGGLVENIYMRNVRVGQVSDAVIRVNFFYEEGDTGLFTPLVRQIKVENLVVKKAKYALYLRGYERSPVKDIQLINCDFGNVDKPSILEQVSGLRMDGVHQE